MAKIKDTTKSEQPDVKPIDNGDSTADTTKTPQQEPTSETKTQEKQQTQRKEESKEIDSHTEAILQSFPNEESLYIDKLGGAYRVGTPERIRGGAKLYTNPYFKK